MRKKLEKVSDNTYTQYAKFENLLCLLVDVDGMESSVKSGITVKLNYLNYNLQKWNICIYVIICICINVNLIYSAANKML